MSLENWANNRWLEKLESDQEEIERLLANADGHLEDYRKAVKSEMSADAQLSLAYDAIREKDRRLDPQKPRRQDRVSFD